MGAEHPKRPATGDAAPGSPAIEVSTSATLLAPRSSVPGASPSGPKTRSWSSEVAPVSVSAIGATAYAADLPPLPPRAAEIADPLVGKRVDHFEIRAQLGQGGMGTVYLAHDLSLDRPVAIKVLRHELAGNEALVDRLILEARAQARLQHPNVVTIYYIGAHEGAPYFAMEYVRGESLESHLEACGAIPWDQALEHAIHAARALAAAHRRGIIHRDVKPSNLILASPEHRASQAGEVMVADFGLAAPTGGREGTFAGSPHYASPEQIDGLNVDHRTDIYALGVTFYQLVTGRRPFDAPTLPELFALHRSAARPAIAEDRCPERLRRLVTEMMAPDRDKRPRSWDEVITRFEGCRPRSSMSGGMVARGMALAVDLTVWAIFGQAIAGLSPLTHVVSTQFGLLLFGAYYVVAHARWKQTLGKHLFHLKIQSTRSRLTWLRLLLRFGVEFWGPIIAMFMINLQLGAAVDLAHLKEHLTSTVGIKEIPVLDESLRGVLTTVLVPNAILAVPWLAGFLLALLDPKRQALHDRAAGTRVVYRHGP